MRIASLCAVVMFSIAAVGQTSNPVKELAPGVISTGSGFAVTFSPDGADAYFTARDNQSAQGMKPPLHLYHSHFSNGAWQPAKALPFSSPQWSDLDPFVTLEGDRLYFVSTRPAPEKTSTKPDMDIWYSDRKDGDCPSPIGLPK